ncbi:DUF4007 family protein [Hymenobacter sp. PAMC 26628]|uniref:DUF4007 family protein n=1 Tax=Hymenobacter sp. PAMC 26628 TaxID=1484118 RepID=UPI00077040F4|nr:DUF4007 family protein [Hymenobacter sp. PAMC 26628]AMJ67544.1 hypothetical protein AXW84_20590 [Hymenobacter sp. PAMC 26628]
MLASRLLFQGHDTFLCRNSWLKKGYDFVQEGGGFNDADAVVRLGVGKNMVTAIRYWLRAFGLANENDELLPVAHELLAATGLDPYVESEATVWYLHYLLVRTGRASLYHFVFNELRKEGFSFNRAQLRQFIVRKCAERSSSINDNTLDSDLTVCLRSYAPSGKSGRSDKVDIEEESNGLLQDLGLLTISNTDEGVRYHIENLERPELPWPVVLRVILENPAWGDNISFTDLEVAPDSPGLVFALNSAGLFTKIEEMIARFPTAIIYSSTAGNRVLTLKRELLDVAAIMQEHYGQTV